MLLVKELNVKVTVAQFFLLGKCHQLKELGLGLNGTIQNEENMMGFMKEPSTF